MIRVKAETSDFKFSYAVHPAYTGADGCEYPFTLHIVVENLPDDGRRRPMLMIVEYDYLQVNKGGDTPPMTIELDVAHPGIDLDRVQLRLRGTYGGHSFPILALEEDDRCGKGVIRDFRNAA